MEPNHQQLKSSSSYNNISNKHEEDDINSSSKRSHRPSSKDKGKRTEVPNSATSPTFDDVPESSGGSADVFSSEISQFPTQLMNPNHPARCPLGQEGIVQHADLNMDERPQSYSVNQQSAQTSLSSSPSKLFSHASYGSLNKKKKDPFSLKNAFQLNSLVKKQKGNDNDDLFSNSDSRGWSLKKQLMNPFDFDRKGTSLDNASLSSLPTSSSEPSSQDRKPIEISSPFNVNKATMEEMQKSFERDAALQAESKKVEEKKQASVGKFSQYTRSYQDLLHETASKISLSSNLKPFGKSEIDLYSPNAEEKPTGFLDKPKSPEKPKNSFLKQELTEEKEESLAPDLSPEVQNELEVRAHKSREKVSISQDEAILIAKLIYDKKFKAVTLKEYASWMCTNYPNRMMILKAFLDLFDFRNVTIILSVRRVCEKILLSAEAQQLDRFVDHFSKRWVEVNFNHGFKNSSVVYTITFSIILLNTDLFNKPRFQRMTKSQFISLTLNPLVKASNEIEDNELNVELLKRKNELSAQKPVGPKNDYPLVYDTKQYSPEEWMQIVNRILKSIYTSLSSNLLPVPPGCVQVKQKNYGLSISKDSTKNWTDYDYHNAIARNQPGAEIGAEGNESVITIGYAAALLSSIKRQGENRRRSMLPVNYSQRSASNIEFGSKYNPSHKDFGRNEIQEKYPTNNFVSSSQYYLSTKNSSTSTLKIPESPPRSNRTRLNQLQENNESSESLQTLTLGSPTKSSTRNQRKDSTDQLSGPYIIDPYSAGLGSRVLIPDKSSRWSSQSTPHLNLVNLAAPFLDEPSEYNRTVPRSYDNPSDLNKSGKTYEDHEGFLEQSPTLTDQQFPSFNDPFSGLSSKKKKAKTHKSKSHRPSSKDSKISRYSKDSENSHYSKHSKSSHHSKHSRSSKSSEIVDNSYVEKNEHTKSDSNSSSNAEPGVTHSSTSRDRRSSRSTSKSSHSRSRSVSRRSTNTEHRNKIRKERKKKNSASHAMTQETQIKNLEDDFSKLNNVQGSLESSTHSSTVLEESPLQFHQSASLTGESNGQKATVPAIHNSATLPMSTHYSEKPDDKNVYEAHPDVLESYYDDNPGPNPKKEKTIPDAELPLLGPPWAKEGLLQVQVIREDDSVERNVDFQEFEFDWTALAGNYFTEEQSIKQNKQEFYDDNNLEGIGISKLGYGKENCWENVFAVVQDGYLKMFKIGKDPSASTNLLSFQTNIIRDAAENSKSMLLGLIKKNDQAGFQPASELDSNDSNTQSNPTSPISRKTMKAKASLQSIGISSTFSNNSANNTKAAKKKKSDLVGGGNWMETSTMTDCISLCHTYATMVYIGDEQNDIMGVIPEANTLPWATSAVSIIAATPPLPQKPIASKRLKKGIASLASLTNKSTPHRNSILTNTSQYMPSVTTVASYTHSLHKTQKYFSPVIRLNGGSDGQSVAVCDSTRFILVLPNKTILLFKAGTEHGAEEYVYSCNYWAARVSKEPLNESVTSDEYGWNRPINEIFEPKKMEGQCVEASNFDTKHRRRSKQSRMSITNDYLDYLKDPTLKFFPPKANEKVILRSVYGDGNYYCSAQGLDLPKAAREEELVEAIGKLKDKGMFPSQKQVRFSYRPVYSSRTNVKSFPLPSAKSTAPPKKDSIKGSFSSRPLSTSFTYQIAKPDLQMIPSSKLAIVADDQLNSAKMKNRATLIKMIQEQFLTMELRKGPKLTDILDPLPELSRLPVDRLQQLDNVVTNVVDRFEVIGGYGRPFPFPRKAAFIASAAFAKFVAVKYTPLNLQAPFHNPQIQKVSKVASVLRVENGILVSKNRKIVCYFPNNAADYIYLNGRKLKISRWRESMPSLVMSENNEELQFEMLMRYQAELQEAFEKHLEDRVFMERMCRLPIQKKTIQEESSSECSSRPSTAASEPKTFDDPDMDSDDLQFDSKGLAPEMGKFIRNASRDNEFPTIVPSMMYNWELRANHLLKEIMKFDIYTETLRLAKNNIQKASESNE